MTFVVQNHPLLTTYNTNTFNTNTFNMHNIFLTRTFDYSTTDIQYTVFSISAMPYIMPYRSAS